MDDIQFKSDTDEFECMDCQNMIKAEGASTEESRILSCEKCGTEYDILARTSGSGLEISMKTKSEPDQVSKDESELQDD